MFSTVEKLFGNLFSTSEPELFSKVLQASLNGKLGLPVSSVASSEHIQTSFCPPFSKPFVYHENTLYLARNAHFIYTAQNAIEQHPSLSIITGGPGTGKTTHAIELIEQKLSSHPNMKIAVTAPTGKAALHCAAQLKKFQTSIWSGTLHALLDLQSHKQVFEKPLPLQFDLVIIDECSMIDLRLWPLLLQATQNCETFLLGDPYQLPPIESAGYFSHMISYLKKNRPQSLTKKTTCHRTTDPHLTLIKKAIEEKKPLVPLLTQSHSSYQFVPLDQWELPPLAQHTSLKEAFEARHHFQILSSLKKGPYGCDQLNRQYLHTLAPDKKAFIPIIVTKNLPHKNLHNGQLGILEAYPLNFSPDDPVTFGSHTLLLHEISSISPAFVLSIHKAQGSEFDTVMCLIPPGSERFESSLLYTAITRAKLSLTLTSSLSVLEMINE